MKRIVLTGGGTAGHVTPNIALIPRLKKLGYEISYIGSYEGIEKKLISDYDIPYYGVSTGKLRRYIDPKNLSDPFRVVKGLAEARKIIANKGYGIKEFHTFGLKQGFNFATLKRGRKVQKCLNWRMRLNIGGKINEQGNI